MLHANLHNLEEKDKEWSWEQLVNTIQESKHALSHMIRFVPVTSIKFKHLPNEKTLHQSKLEAFADDKLKVIQIAKILLDKTENIVRKEENAGYQHFVLIPKMFSKGYFFWADKNFDWLRV